MKILKFKLMEETPGTGGSTSTPSTPSSSSAPSSAPASTESPDSGDFDFAALAMDSGDSGEVAAPAAPAVTIQPSAAPSSGAAASTTPAATPAAPAIPSQAPAAPAAQPPAAAAPVPAAPPAAQGQNPGQPQASAPQSQNPTEAPAQPLSKEAIAQAFARHRETFLPQLQQIYTIPETEVEELRTAPETALPKLAAKLHYEIQMATFQSIVDQLPQLLSPILDHRTQVEKFTNEFKKMWPDLHSKPEYEAVAENAIRSIRAVNPKMPMMDVLKQAGMVAMMTLGLPLPAPGASAAPQAPTAPVPAAPAPAMAPPIARPPGIGASSSPLQAPGNGDEGNIWAEMAAAHLRGE